jgi:oligopeptide/dipeptide ABC transporter ATP-binding protein
MTRAIQPSHEALLLSVRDLQVEFSTDEGIVKAVNGVSFDVHRGEVFAIVGESGSGKSVSAMSLLGLVPDATITGGEALWRGEDLLKMTPAEIRAIRGAEIGMIFQDPLTSLNPVHKVGRQIGEVLRIHENVSKSVARRKAIDLLDRVGIPRAHERIDNYPHEFSGGMRQRVMIAMAIACDPLLLIADEPTTALDVTVQAQVLDVLMEIKTRINSAILLITHDLGVVAEKADRVMVMYAGREVEVADTDGVFYDTSHPYTLGLLGALPRLDETGRGQLRPIRGAPPSLTRIPSGCPFHPRCDFARCPAPCETTEPPLLNVGAVHEAACHFSSEVRAQRQLSVEPEPTV